MTEVRTFEILALQGLGVYAYFSAIEDRLSAQFQV